MLTVDGKISFQKVQGLAAVQTSLYFIPNVATGIVLSISTGVILHKVSVYWLVILSCCVTAVAPLLMAVNSPDWTYWYACFWSVFLSPFAGNSTYSHTYAFHPIDTYPLASAARFANLRYLVLFIVSALVITSTFSDDTQALAGAVFNTFSQFGTAVGLAVVAVISSSASQSYSAGHADSGGAVAAGENSFTPRELLEGYRATFWALFAAAMLTSVIGAFGLRHVSNKGMKTD